MSATSDSLALNGTSPKREGLVNCAPPVASEDKGAALAHRRGAAKSNRFKADQNPIRGDPASKIRRSGFRSN
jgi:hypothetical protein